jgi:hypothetical protein
MVVFLGSFKQPLRKSRIAMRPTLSECNDLNVLFSREYSKYIISAESNSLFIVVMMNAACLALFHMDVNGPIANCLE